jgi:mono/diheme cytochrome c family protein
MKRIQTLSWSKRGIDAFLICLLGSASACGPQLENFVTGDEARYGVTAEGTAEFQAALTVLNNNCVACHSDYGSLSEAEWIASGKVVAGNPSASTLYQNIRGSGVGAQNMPPSSTIGPSELSAISTWITNASP